MLVLTRKANEGIVIGDDIEVTILDIQGSQVRVGIKAPRSLSVYRKEIYLAIQQENIAAASGIQPSLDLKDIFSKSRKDGMKKNGKT